MDNRKIDLVTEGGVDTIKAALSLIWTSAAAGGRATHWKVMRLRSQVTYYCREPQIRNMVVGTAPVPEVAEGRQHSHSERLVEDLQAGRPVLILLWHDEQGSQALPYPLDLDQAATFIDGWLDSPAADFGARPDIDGDTGRGWRMFTEDWGHVAGHHYAIVGVTAAWAMYGK